MLVSRRHFFFGSLALPALAAKKPAPLRPAIVLMVADQVPAWMLGCYGNKQIRTPNLDRLAQMGIRFANHFACAPAPGLGRATLLTGRTPMQIGASGVPTAEDATVAKILAEAGYATQESDQAGALAFLDRQSPDKPFFLQVNCPGLSAPFDSIPKKYFDSYAIEPFEGYAADRPAPNAKVGKEMLADILGNVRKSAASLSAMDDDIGALLAKLGQKNLRNNTLIVFTAACGGLMGRHGLWDGAQGSDPANMFDSAVTTPIVWSWLGHVPALAQRPELLSAYDFVPTLCDLLTIPQPKRNLCGRSYALLVTGKPLPKKQPWRLILCAHLENTDMGREERYKLVLRDDGRGPNELYDLAIDPGERDNQFENQQFLTIHTELADAITKWKQKYSA
jgi:arylsulfatase A-like enzyme